MPIATAVYALPKIALLPLMIIAFGLGETSKIAIVALSIFFLVALNTMSGVLAIKDMYVGLLVTGILGWVLTIGLDVIERLVIPWRREEA